MELLVLGLGNNGTSLSETILMFALSDTYINVTPFLHSFLACCLCNNYSFFWLLLGHRVFGAEVSNTRCYT